MHHYFSGFESFQDMTVMQMITYGLKVRYYVLEEGDSLVVNWNVAFSV